MTTSAANPILTTSALYPLRLRADLPRDVANSYWAGPHAEIVKRLPHLVEYNQYHFAMADHGYWPATPKVGTTVPLSWPIDGLTEVRFPGMAAALRIPLHMREVFLDEQNVFDDCLGHLIGPGGGRWWTAGHDDSVSHRTVLLVRRRRGVWGRSFRAFVHTRLTGVAAGSCDVRTYSFLPMAPVAHSTFGVSHDNPPAPALSRRRRLRHRQPRRSRGRNRLLRGRGRHEGSAPVLHGHPRVGVDRTVPVIRTNMRDIDVAN
jgi:hypothetical protein